MPLILLVTVFAAAAAQGQTATVGDPAAGAFAGLAPGDRKIAVAIYRREPISLQTGLKPMPLDDIAAARRIHDSWRALFNDMRRQGLVAARSFDEAISSRPSGRPAVTPHSSFVVTLGNGRNVMIGKTEETAAMPSDGSFDASR